MLTVLTETGRAKCHQYWPKVGTTPLKATNSLSVLTNSEQNFGHYVQREMLLKVSVFKVHVVIFFRVTVFFFIFYNNQ